FRRQNQNLDINAAVRVPIIGCEPNIIAGMPGSKVVKAWNKPTHGKGAETGHVQNAAIASAYDAKRVLDLIESGGQGEAEYSTLCGELRTVSGSLEQWCADERLKMAHMTADRPMAHPQFLGGRGHLAMPGSGFKRSQRGDR